MRFHVLRDRSEFKMAIMAVWDRLYTIIFIFNLFNEGLSQRCPNGWKDRPGGYSCYLFGVGVPRRSWGSARQHCQSSQGELLKIDDVVEKNWVLEEISQLDKTYPGAQEFWVGLNAKDDFKTWKWANGEIADMSLIRWGSGEPSDPVNEQCAEIWDNLFNDKSCMTPIEYVCERSKSIPLTCDVDLGWQYYGGTCYKYTPAYRTFTQAKTACEMNDAGLVSVTSDDIQQTVNHLAALNDAQDAWIGLTRKDGKWTFVDKTPFNAATKTYWQSVIPSGSDEVCVTVNATAVSERSWYAVSCTEGRAYICTKPEGVCTPGFDQHQSRCYLSVFTNMTWDNAYQYCQDRDSRLVDIRSASHQSFITGYLMKQKLKGMNKAWISLTRGTGGADSWTWTPDEFDQITYSNWAIGANMRSAPSGKTCAYINAGDDRGEWRSDLDCTKNAFFVCVGDVLKPNPVTTAPSSATVESIPGTTQDVSRAMTLMSTTTTETITRRWNQKCGENWEKSPFSEYCYQVNEKKLNWMEADEQCAVNGGRLLSISSVHEQFYIAGLIRWKVYGSYWIGANSRREEEGWRWSDRSAFAFMNWKPGQPDDVKGEEDCVVMSVDTSYWSDFSCDLKFGYICKKLGLFKTTFPPPPTAIVIPEDKSYGCPEDWVGYQDICFLIVRMKKSWLKARNYCRKQGGDLASITNEDEYNFLFSQLPKNHCYNLHNNDSACTAWAKQGECTKNPVWMAKKCHLACNLCIQDCRNIYNLAQCKHWTSMGECEKNPKWMLKNCALSCGVCDSAIYGGFWIGLNDRAFQMAFRWTDGQKVSFTSWAKGEPNNFGLKQEDCVSMFLQDGKWNDANCGNDLPGFICKQDKKLLPKSTISPLSVGCVNGSMGYSAYCYQFIDESKSYNDAEENCNTLGGHLATINNRYVQAFIASQLVGKSADYWIGLSDQINPGTLETWTSGVDVDFTHWVRTHTGDEDGTCVYLLTTHPVGLWDKANCSLSKAYICEYLRTGYTTTTTTPGTTTTTLPPSCEAGWTATADYCFKVFGKVEKRTWMEARDTCRNMGGDLPSIHSMDEENVIFSLLQGFWASYWIGFNDRASESSFTWSDGTAVDYTDWLDNEPNDAYYNEDCACMMSWTKKWNDVHCSYRQAFVCKVRKGISVVEENATVTNDMGSCDGNDPDWVFHAGYCYFMYDYNFQREKMNWYEAQDYCRYNNSELVSVHSSDEANFLISLTTSKSSPYSTRWIGLNEIDLEKGYRWSDGTPLNFIYWSRSEPSDKTGGERCVMLQNGRWHDTNCGSKLTGFICKKKNGTNTPPPTSQSVTPLIPAGCPPNFIMSPDSNKCYLFKNTAVLWRAAVAECSKLGKGVQLLSISNELEQKYIASLLKNYQSNPLWIGFNDRLHRGEYIWVDNSRVLYTNWAKGEPNGRSENCVEMYTRPKDVGQWNDLSCYLSRGYACQAFRNVQYPLPTLPGVCAEGYQAYDNSCYKLLETEMDFETAKTHCQIHGATLASITSPYEQAFVDIISKKVTDKFFWIGLTREEPIGPSNITTVKDFKWMDGWPVYYMNWGTNKPALREGAKCVVVQKGKWIDTSCDVKVAAVCEINLGGPPTTPVPGICPDGTYSYKDYCYTAEIRNKKNWIAAKADCEGRGMTLSSINSREELNFILEMLRSMAGGNAPKTWIGFTRYKEKRQESDDYYDYDYDGDGDDDDDVVGFRWIDGSKTVFQNWNDGEPSDSWNNQNEECTEMYSHGRWNDVNCYDYNKAFVCKSRQIYKTQTTTTVTTTAAETTTEVITTTRPPTNPVVTQSVVTPSVVQSTDITDVTGVTMTTKTTTKKTAHHYIPRRTNPKLKRETKKGLTAGEIIGIVIGIVGLGVIGGAIYFVVYRVARTNTYNTKEHGFSNALYLKSADNVSLSEDTSMMGSTVKLCEKQL